MYVKLDQNNSGGSFWLNDQQFDALLADGWVVADQRREATYGRAAQNLAIDIPVKDPQTAVTVAKIEFGRVTGFDPDDEGCNCCGQPFYFDSVAPGDYDYEAIVKAMIPTVEAVEIDAGQKLLNA